MQTPDFTLSRNSLGKLVMTLVDGTSHAGVVPVRAFPISAAGEGLSLMSADGKELAWIANLDTLPAAMRALIEAELAAREFMPEIRKIVGVSTYATRARGQCRPIAATPISCCAAKKTSAA
ncbi:Domain of uncharacterised function (DUF1854) [Ralstonia mannitolilytica]|nr:Domain of uncharacterised function (DUF1854) [Ralstonia mannitolilytica]